MAKEEQAQQKSPDRRETPKDSRPGKEPAPHNGPPLLNDGPELVRDSHC
jgi:hypothetical protein